jgi:hypothetical protein
MSEKAVVTVQSEDGPPTLEIAARQLGVPTEAVDEDFGVVLIDPTLGLYSVQVDAARLPSNIVQEKPFRGPFSAPRIEPFGTSRGVPSDSKNKKG